ncbi:ferritin [Porphyromonas macacae]|uniref:Ferritin n=1 Tax=Porphyromonas macacae TaxID=28115 RepID=A0A0A2E440_9PORP|nr:ferritin [Porphyromonas macacae]KGN73683.1 ferritin [Porphyromonas macacae]SUB88218.1 Ferritin [Porphyromonas macacae]
MELNKKMEEAINRQINAEMWSSHLYLAMSVHFGYIGLNGFSHWMRKQAEEEMEHAYAMIDYLSQRGGRPQILPIQEVPNEFGSPLQIMEQVLKHECIVSESIIKLVHLSDELLDLPSHEFFMTFVKEQVEEEASVNDIITQIKLYGEQHEVLVDHHLKKR